MQNKSFSLRISVFHGRVLPEQTKLVGYGAIMDSLNLPVPLPRRLALISEVRRKYENEDWIVLTPRHQPKESLYGHLVFSLKYEGINLLFFKKLFRQINQTLIEQWVKNEPFSLYSRKLWYLYEWLMNKKLAVPDLKEGNYVKLLDEKLQYANPQSVNVTRQRIKNNLPGNVNFCPLVHKNQKLEKYIAEDFSAKTEALIKNFHTDIMIRTSSFLLLKDSRASFAIEGEIPAQKRAIGWGRAIGQAGNRQIDKEELYRLQQIIIEDQRFVKMGYRDEGGFVGEYERNTGEPIPEHISARWDDVETLMTGLLEAARQMADSGCHPVLTAAAIAFGFVYIHPFADGNGRLHRYLIHHYLSSMKFTPKGIIFPVSAAILEWISDYRKVLESYSQPLLEFILWEKTIDNNINVLNETIDYYRYFDATAQTEFLFACVDYTIKKIIPEEAQYLQRFDEMKVWLGSCFEMPGKTVALLIRFLQQNNGKFSKRAKEYEFSALTNDEIIKIENKYSMVFGRS
ncbi:MAG: Fic family protein [Ignavibacteriales bacterium]|nr:Fic family protein [Ignavibacteriales bacterium]